MMDPSDNLVGGGLRPDQSDFLTSVLELGKDFLSGSVRDGKALVFAEDEALASLADQSMPLEGVTRGELLEKFRSIVARHSIAQHDPGYLAFPDVGSSEAAIAADILNAFLNQNLIAVTRSAPIATFIEIQLLLWLRELLGFQACRLSGSLSLADVGAAWTPGGNLSNAIGVLAALHNRFPNLRKEGLASLDKRPAVVIAQDIDHFSFANAVSALGIGSDNIAWVPAAESFRTDPEAVEDALTNLDDSLAPFMLVAVAGNCRTTSVDDLRSLRAIADRHGLWLHVDACHGGSLLFSDLHRGMLAGIESADSVSLDPHKGLFVGYPSSYIAFREGKDLARLSRYPDRAETPGVFDLGLTTPFLGSRGFHSLKLWALWQQLGASGIGQLVESRQLVNARYISLLAGTAMFQPLNQTDFYRTAYVFLPNDLMPLWSQALKLAPDAALTILNRYTDALNESLYRDGRVIFDSYVMTDLSNALGAGPAARVTVLGMSVGHTSVTEQQLDDVRSVILQHAERLAPILAQALEEASNTAAAMPTQTGPAGW